MSRLISLIVLLTSIVIIGALFYKVMIGFLVPVFLAAVLVVVFRPLHRWVLAKVGHREHIAAGITTLLVIISVLLPAGLVITMAAAQGTTLISGINPAAISVGLNNARKKIGLQSPCQENIRSIQNSVEEIQREVGSSNMTELMDSSGSLAGLTRKIHQDIDELLPNLRRFLDKEVENNLRQAAQTPDVDEKTTEVLQKKLAAEADAEYEMRSREWNEPILRFHDSVDKLTEAIGLPLSRPDRKDLMRAEPPKLRMDLVELQSMAIDLGMDWQQTKLALLGGQQWMASLREFTNPSPKQLRDLTTSVIGWLQPKIILLTGATAEFLIRLLIGTAVMVISLYFFLYDGPRMVHSLMKLSPLDDRYELELLTEFDRVSRAIVLAMVLSAIVQGLTAGIGYYVAGMPSLVFLTLLSMLCGLIPFVGPSVIWVPVCIYLAVFEERLVAAGLLAIWGLVAVASIDNVVKAYVLHGQSQLHPLLALLSVLGGVQALGPIGLVVGPISVVMLQTLLSILRREVMHIDDHVQERSKEHGQPSPGNSISNWMNKLKRRPTTVFEQDSTNPHEPTETPSSLAHSSRIEPVQ
jgi:predicted PurR-regulated permease PerM